MKAKEYYAKFVECTTGEELENSIAKCLRSLITEANKLIKTRRATSDKAVAACINEVNNRWIAICNLHENATYDEDHPMHGCKLLKDGFKAAYVAENPNKGWYFDLKNHREYISKEEEKMQINLIMRPTLKLFGLIPYEEITKDNIHSEILHTLYVIGSNCGNSAITPTLLKPLAYRVRLLRYWASTGNINYSDVDEMEKDPYNFFEERKIPI